MRLWVVAAMAATVACGSSKAALQKAGAPGDDGDGLLGKYSMSMVTEDRPDDEGSDVGDFPPTDNRDSVESRDDPPEPKAFGGQAYGGSGYANFYVRPWSVNTPDRTPNYHQVEYLKGTLEGTIRWAGATPSTLTTKCGVVPAMRVGADKALPGVVVYIEAVETGRMVTGEETRVLNVGGTVAKRGCAFEPPTQVVAPVPAAVTVYGDRQASKPRVQVNGTEPKTFTLEGTSHASATVDSAGYSRVDSEDGTLGAAFVVGLATQYYAVSDDRGHFRIDELAPGSYTVTIWQAPLPKLVSGKLEYGTPTVTTRKVTIPKSAERAIRLDLSLGR